jgi:hypothetical protein
MSSRSLETLALIVGVLSAVAAVAFGYWLLIASR